MRTSENLHSTHLGEYVLATPGTTAYYVCVNAGRESGSEAGCQTSTPVSRRKNPIDRTNFICS